MKESRTVTLFALGRRTNRGDQLGLLHRWGLILAALSGVVAIWAGLAVLQISAQRDMRLDQRSPELIQQDESRTPVGWFIETFDMLDDGVQFSVVALVPNTDAAPPLGIPRWPGAGEAFLSPALANEFGENKDRYGKFAGTIADGGLADLNERLVYYRPPANVEFDTRAPLEPISGFGTGQRYMYLNQTGPWRPVDILALIAILVAIPALAFALIAARTGSERRDRRLAMLHALGASSSDRAWVVLGESFLPVSLGAIGGGVLAALSTFVDLPLIFTDYIVYAGDLAGVRWVITPIILIVMAILMSATVAAHARLRVRRGATSPRAVHGALRTWPQFGWVIGGTLTVWGTANHGVEGRLAFLAGMALVLICLPLTASWLAGLLGGMVARLGRSFGAPGLLVGGRWLSARPAMLARVAAVFVIALTLVSQVQVVRTIITETQGASLTLRQTVGTQIVTVFGRDRDRTAQSFWSAIGRQHQLVLIDKESKDGTITHTLVGSCEILARLGRLPSCPTAPVPFDDAVTAPSSAGTALRALYTLFNQRLMVASQREDQTRIQRHIVINDNGAAGYAHIRTIAFQTMAAPVIEVPGQGWLGSVTQAKQDVNWLLSFGLIALLILLCIGALAMADVFVTQCRELGMLSTYRSDRRLYLWIAFWNLTLPMVLVTSVGSIASALLGRMLVARESSGEFSTSFLTVASLITLIVALLIGLLCGLVASRAARRWRPTMD